MVYTLNMPDIKFYYGSPGFGKTTKAIRMTKKLKDPYLFIYSPIKEETFYDVLESRNGDCLPLLIKPEFLNGEFFRSKEFVDAKTIVVDEIQNRTLEEIDLLIEKIDKQNKNGLFFGTLYDCRGNLLKTSHRILEKGIISEQIPCKCKYCDSLAFTSLYYNEEKHQIYFTVTEKDMDDPNCKLVQVCRKCLKHVLNDLQAF